MKSTTRDDKSKEQHIFKQIALYANAILSNNKISGKLEEYCGLYTCKRHAKCDDSKLASIPRGEKLF